MEFWLILCGGVLIFYSIYAREKKAAAKNVQLEADLTELRKEVIVVTSSSIPGREIKRVFGNVTGISDTQSSSREEFILAEKEAMYKMIVEAKRIGANAIMDLKRSTGTYEQQGSKRQVSQAVYNGTAVLVS